MINHELDLTLDLVIAAPREKVWQALTQPELIQQWFAPKPYTTPECRLDLRCGGEFYTLMQAPDGEQYPNSGCFTEVIAPEKLCWTDALTIDFRPAEQAFMTVHIRLSDHGEVTGYHLTVMHKSTADRQKHNDMGFTEGWTQCAKQLEAVANTL
ncbi:SRPBCC family protein [Alkanindiges sp. WGS2144]|uniref:SRPBCC family protein n=1 Tax=Alkanindiges sp. WGS2144 TaxID=3366808 RepID=UPI0037518B07